MVVCGRRRREWGQNGEKKWGQNGGENEKPMGDGMVVSGEEYGGREKEWLGSRKRGERREKRKIKIK